MSQVTLTIDGKEVTVAAGATVLEAARKAAINIPVLCHHPELRPEGACRICVVEIEGARNLPASCVTPAAQGMVVRTNTPAVREARRTNLELLLANHPQDCFTCERNNHCELQKLAHDLGVRKIEIKGLRRDLPLDFSGSSLVRDPNKCILCGRCVRVCSEVQGVSVLDYADRGFNAMVYPPLKRPLEQVACVNCGQCATVCPVGAITEKSHVDQVWEALAEERNHVVVQVAPAVRVSIGEELGMKPGSVTTGKLVAALRRLGFHRVFDTDFTADLTIMEEGHELLNRLENGGVLPMFTSCSPGWIKYIEHHYPEMLDHLSSCKSPQQMFGALAKSYYAEKAGYSARDIFVVSVMPCTAKKYEAARPGMDSSGVADVDAVLTTRELGRMIREAGIDFAALPDESFDEPLGISTGAGVIFGATGGVAEAALRTLYEVVTGKELQDLDFTAVRGLEGIKEACVTLQGRKIRVAVAHGLKNAAMLMDKLKAGEAEYDFVEVMCCPGGCIGGGGQPIPVDRHIREARLKAIYEVDQGMQLRKSHLNPAVQELYRTFLGKPLSKKSHDLLHTHYLERSRV